MRKRLEVAMSSTRCAFYLCSDRSQETLQESCESLSFHRHDREYGPYPLQFWIWNVITNTTLPRHTSLNREHKIKITIYQGKSLSTVRTSMQTWSTVQVTWWSFALMLLWCLGRGGALFLPGKMLFLSPKGRGLFAGFVKWTTLFVILKRQMTRNTSVMT